MLSVVLVSVSDVTNSSATGLCLASFAEAFVQRGIRVHVICKANAQAKPSIESNGLYTIERLSIRRGSPDTAFIVSAINRVHSLISTGQCDVVQSIDLPDCIVGLRMSLSMHKSQPALIAVLTNPEQHTPYERERLILSADHTVTTRQGVLHDDRIPSITPPPTPSAWHLPKMDGHVLILCESDNQSRVATAEAYRRSGLNQSGWAMIALESDGSWSKYPARPGVLDIQYPRRVLFGPHGQQRSSIVEHAIRFGVLSYPEFCSCQLQTVAQMSDIEYQEARKTQQNSTQPLPDSDTVIDELKHFWEKSSRREMPGRLSLWQAIARSMTNEELGIRNEQSCMKCSKPASPKIQIAIEHTDGVEHIEIDTVTQSCWAPMFGGSSQPTNDALDQLAKAFGGVSANRVIISGCPSACVLPMLWMRTIWLAGTNAQIILKWNQVEDPKSQPKMQAAGILGCELADRIECSDPAHALKLWGIDVDQQNQCQSGVTPRSFDALVNMFDLWDTDKEHMASAGDWTDTIRRAMLNCAQMGYQRIAIYGAGTHTQTVGEAFMNPPVELVCIIDDDERRYGDRLWGFEIVSREQALDMQIDAVILSANSIEDTLWERSGMFRESGITVIRLYGQQANETVHVLGCER